MKTEIRPGKILEHLAPEEFLKAHEGQNDMILKLLGKNATFRRAVFSIKAPGVAIVSNPDNGMAPPDGFMWQVMGVSWAAPANGAIAGNWYLNERQPINLFATQNSNSGILAIPAKTIIVHTGDYLSFQSNANVAADQVTLMVLAIEVPSAHEAQLLL
jgi:hypothetical protein